MLGIPNKVSDDDKLLTYCCVSGCKINSRTNPDIMFHVLNTENLTFQNTKNCKIHELKICNEHYFSADPLNISVENIASNPSDLNTPTFEVVPTNYDPISNFFDTAPSPSQTEIDAIMPELNLTEDLSNDDLEICCVCLLDGNLKNIENEIVDNNQIKDMLQKFNYLNCPNFPKKICEPCLHDLIISYNFIIRFENSTKHLISSNSNFVKSVEKETFLNSQKKVDKLDEIDNKYDLMINIEKNKRLFGLLEKFTKENLIKLKRQIEKKDRINKKIITTMKKRNSTILKEIYKNRILINMKLKTKNRINKNKKLKRNVTEKVSNKTQSKLTNEIRKKSNKNKQKNTTNKNKKVNKTNARKPKRQNEDKTLSKSTKLPLKDEFPQKPNFELPAEIKKKIIEKTKPYSQKEKLEKLIELFKLANPFLTDVIINENFKESNGEKNKRRSGRKTNLKTIKNRVLIVTTAQIQEIIENNIFPNEIKLENPAFSPSEKALFFAQAYPCASCDKCFLCEDFLNRHYCEAEEKNALVLETKDWKCEICLKDFCDLQRLVTHHCLSTFDCKRCPNSYETIDAVKRHIARKHPLSDPEKFQCEFCGKEFQKKAYIRKHMINLHYEFYVSPTKKKTRNF